MIYGLYHNKEELKLEIKPFDRDKTLNHDEIAYQSDKLFLCNNIKPLREMANILRSKWKAEFESNIDKLNKKA